jgi:hypothetical protein
VFLVSDLAFMVCFLQQFASWSSFCFASPVVIRSILQPGTNDVFCICCSFEPPPHKSDLLFHCRTVCILSKFSNEV